MKKVFSIIILSLMVAPAFAQVGVFDKAADWTLDTADNLKAVGLAEFSDGSYVIEGNGDDIWNSADEGYYIYTDKSGSVTISSLVSWIDPGTNEWSKAIVMIREKGDAPGSKYLGSQLRGNDWGDQVHATWRTTEDGGSASSQFFLPPIDPTDPLEEQVALQAMDIGIWLRTTRIAELNLMVSEWSEDGETWYVGRTEIIEMGDNVTVGLAVTNHENDDNVAIAEFSNIEITDPVELPVMGTRAFSNGGFTADQTITISLEVLNPNPDAESLTVTDTVPEGWTISDVSDGGSASGSTVTWNLDAEFGFTTVTYNATAPADPTFTNTWQGWTGDAYTGGSATLALIQDKPEGDQVFDKHADIFRDLDELGGEAFLGDATYDADEGVYTVSGAGVDIWGNYDEFHFLYTELSGDFVFTARIIHDESERSTSTDDWIKGMLMARQNLTAGSVNFGNRLRRDGQYSWQMRDTQDGGSTSDSDNRVTFSSEGYAADAYPLTRLERIGDEWNIYYKDELGNGEWVQVQSTQTLVMEDPIFVGLAVTAHQSGSIQYTWFSEVELDIKGPVSVSDWALY